MRGEPGTQSEPGEKVVKDIRCATHKQYSAEEKIRIVPESLRYWAPNAELCRREGIARAYLAIVRKSSVRLVI